MDDFNCEGAQVRALVYTISCLLVPDLPRPVCHYNVMYFDEASAPPAKPKSIKASP